MTVESKIKMEVFADADALAIGVADWLLALTQETHGAFAVALAGGSTPRRLYELLASPAYRDKVPWSRMHWFWGDERFVPHDDARSNFRMAQAAMLSRAPLANIHAMRTEGLTPELAASAYERALKAFYGAEQRDPARPLFDVVLLGLGADGHTASLFPGTDVLGERSRWAAPVIGANNEPRITLTYPTLESTRHAAFLVTGEDKKEILKRFMSGDDRLPATHLRPTSGKVTVFADLAAAGDAARSGIVPD